MHWSTSVNVLMVLTTHRQSSLLLSSHIRRTFRTSGTLIGCCGYFETADDYCTFSASLECPVVDLSLQDTAFFFLLLNMLL